MTANSTLPALRIGAATRSGLERRGYFGTGAICQRSLSRPGCRARLRGRSGRGLFVDHLAHLLELGIYAGFDAFDALLAQIDRIGQQTAALLDSLSVSAFFHLNALGFEELAEVVE